MTNPTETAKAPPFIICGLGNFGREHARSRHNAGYWFIDRIAERWPVASVAINPRFRAYAASTRIEGERVMLIKPLAFMNQSGQVVRSLLDFRKMPASEVLVVHDDLDLPAGVARLKFGGGHGGHNGLRDVIRHCGADFPRLRLGIGHPGDPEKVTPYVLSPPSATQREAIDAAMQAALDAVNTLYRDGMQAAMNQLHAPVVH